MDQELKSPQDNDIFYRNLTRGFIESADKSEWNLYCDTDSSYNKVPVPFNKFEDIKQTAKFSNQLTNHFNGEYLKCFSNTIGKFGGIDPKYNRMFFKAEIIAYRGFFNAKKYYGLAKMWDEGTFFDTPKVKKTGGQIIKSDSSKIVQDLLNEIYAVLLLDFEIKDVSILYRKIFHNIRVKYIQRTKLAVHENNISDFGIPKKWSSGVTKTIPIQVKGAMFWNYLITNNIRPGDSLIMCQIKVNPAKLKTYFNSNNLKSKYLINEKDLNQKLKYISLPVDVSEQEFNKLMKLFQELGIQFDMESIVEFNVFKKIDQFSKLFSLDIQKKYGKTGSINN